MALVPPTVLDELIRPPESTEDLIRRDIGGLAWIVKGNIEIFDRPAANFDGIRFYPKANRAR